MSLVFSDTTNYRGIVQEFEREIGASLGDISGNTTQLKQLTASVNLAFDDYLTLAIQTSGKWKFDDSNHTDFPEITTDLVANQREYTFTTDEQGNLILDIYKAYVLTDGKYKEIKAIDPDSETVAQTNYDGLNTTGTPTEYDKKANAILLNLVPPANVTDGLKVSINREASYFTYTDTTKKPGVPGLHHKWFYLRPAMEYARRHTLTSYPRIEAEFMKVEREIKEYFDRRAKDEPQRLTVYQQNNR